MSRSIAAAYGIAGLSAAIAAIAVFAPMPDRAEPALTEPIAVEEVVAPTFAAPAGALPTAPLAAEAVASQDASPRAQRLARAAAPPRPRASAAPAAQEEVVYVDERGRPIDPRMASAAPRWEREEDEDEEHEEREHSRRGGSRERDDD